MPASEQKGSVRLRATSASQDVFKTARAMLEKHLHSTKV